MIVLDMELDFVSINRKYNKNFSLTDAYRGMKRKLISSMDRSVGFINPPYSIEIHAEMYLDIDNPVKCIIDALGDSGIIDNDKNILECHLYKTKIKKGSTGNLKVFINSMEVPS
jgi:Holliday junction resolvase RusA-like endonuclease